MPFDIVAWYQSTTAIAALAAIAGVADDIYKVSGDDIIVKKRAPFLAGWICLSDDTKTVKYSEFRQPSLKIPYRSYMSASYESEGDLYNAFLNLFASPLPLYPGEKLNALMLNNTSTKHFIAAWLASGKAPLSALENVSPTHMITGSNTALSLTAGSWSDVAITWDQSLPKGRYAIIGMDVGLWKTGNAIGMGVARLKLLDTTWRPGVITHWTWAELLANWGGKGLSNFRGKRWPVMPGINFAHDELPDIEVCAMDTETDAVINLLLQKIS